MTTTIKQITRGELTCWEVRHRNQTLVITEQGAQVLEYQRDDEPPLIWLSEDAAYQNGQGVRGGVPVCWPWFGGLNFNPTEIRQQYTLAQPPAHGLVLVAPAPDMTHELMQPGFTLDEHQAMQAHGYVEQPSQYSDEPYRINKALIDDGEQHLLFGRVIETGCPVIILQGGQDPDVPQAHAIKLVTHLLHDRVTLTLIPDGDHRLSRPQDLALLTEAVSRLAEPQ